MPVSVSVKFCIWIFVQSVDIKFPTSIGNEVILSDPLEKHQEERKIEANPQVTTSAEISTVNGIHMACTAATIICCFIYKRQQLAAVHK